MSFGISMMIEGIKDMFNAVCSAYKADDIDWGKWGKDKIISYGVMIFTAGMSCLKEIGTLAK